MVSTPFGLVAGVTDSSTSVSRYLRIPYAPAPVRWAAPAPPVPWSGVLDGTAFGPQCIQWAGFAPNGIPESEDCLQVNVFVPAAATPDTPLPVFIAIHGGGFTQGSAAGIDGSFLAAAVHAVVFTLQYRLGPYGSLTVPGTSPSGLPSDYVPNTGLLDQRAALDFIARIAPSFGGDVSRMTLGGHSAGGVSAAYQLLLDPAAPLPAPVPPLPHLAGALLMAPSTPGQTRDMGEAASTALAAAVNCTCSSSSSVGVNVNVTCLRGVPLPALLAASLNITGSVAIAWGPIIDGAVITADWVAALTGRVPGGAPGTNLLQPGLPLLMGDTLFEGDLFAAAINQGLFGSPLTDGSMTRAQYAQALPPLLQQARINASSGSPALAAVTDDYAACLDTIGVFNTSAAVAGDGFMSCNVYWLARGMSCTGGIGGEAVAGPAGATSAQRLTAAANTSSPVWRYTLNISLPQLMASGVQPLDRPTHGADWVLLFNGSVPPPFGLPEGPTLQQQAAMQHGLWAYLANFLAFGDPNVGAARPAAVWPLSQASPDVNTTLLLQAGTAGNPAPTALLPYGFQADACDPVWWPLVVR